VDDVIDHQQGRRTILQLLAFIHADVDPPLAAAGTEAGGFGQFVMADLARQVVRQAAAAMRPAAMRRGHRSRFVRGGAVVATGEGDSSNSKSWLGSKRSVRGPYNSRSSQSI